MKFISQQEFEEAYEISDERIRRLQELEKKRVQDFEKAGFTDEGFFKYRNFEYIN